MLWCFVCWVNVDFFLNHVAIVYVSKHLRHRRQYVVPIMSALDVPERYFLGPFLLFMFHFYLCALMHWKVLISWLSSVLCFLVFLSLPRLAFRVGLHIKPVRFDRPVSK